MAGASANHARISANILTECTHHLKTEPYEDDATGSPMLVQNHAQRKPDFRRGKKLGTKDYLIEWEKPKRKPG